MKRFILFFILIFVLTGNFVSAQNCSIRLELEKKQYLYSEPVIVCCYFKNETGAQIETPAKPVNYSRYKPTSMDLYLYDENGKLLEIYGRDFGISPIFKKYWNPGDSDLVVLYFPALFGNATEGHYSVLNYMHYLFSGVLKEGNYTFKIEYTLPEINTGQKKQPKIKCVSNTISFSVIRPETTPEAESYRIYNDFLERDYKFRLTGESPSNEYLREYYDGLIDLKSKIKTTACRQTLLIEILSRAGLRPVKESQDSFKESYDCFWELIKDFPESYRLYKHGEGFLVNYKGKIGDDLMQLLKKTAFYRMLKGMHYPLEGLELN